MKKRFAASTMILAMSAATVTLTDHCICRRRRTGN